MQKNKFNMKLPALVRFSQQDVYMSLTILGCTVNCRFRFADCPLIHCASSSNKIVLSCLPGQPKSQNMPDGLGEHQFILLENFETIYISTNRTVPFMSQSFIAGSAILCHFMPNDKTKNKKIKTQKNTTRLLVPSENTCICNLNVSSILFKSFVLLVNR